MRDRFARRLADEKAGEPGVARAFEIDRAVTDEPDIGISFNAATGQRHIHRFYRRFIARRVRRADQRPKIDMPAEPFRFEPQKFAGLVAHNAEIETTLAQFREKFRSAILRPQRLEMHFGKAAVIDIARLVPAFPEKLRKAVA